METTNYTFQSNLIRRPGFWQSCFAASAAFVLPPMTCHYYRDLYWPGKQAAKLTAPPLLMIEHGGTLFAANKKTYNSKTVLAETTPRIAIIGGGIAGVTAADALSKKFSAENIPVNIVVFEGDERGSNNKVDFLNHEQPTWMAATARNANTICPGASFHVMSQRMTVIKIMKDTIREWYHERLESIQKWLMKDHIAAIVPRVDNFDIVPPYFALHLFRCVGPSASWDERATFITFLRSFLKTCLLSTEHDIFERGKLIHKMAKSNRLLFLEAIDGSNDLALKTGLGRGFISLYRTKQDALHDFHEGESYGEDFSLLSFEEASTIYAVKLEPRLLNLPISEELFAVHRKNDYTADCATFIREITLKLTEYGVEYRSGNQGRIDDIGTAKKAIEQSSQLVGSNSNVLATDPVMNQQRFSLRTKDGHAHEFDFVVLAAGVNTPLFARMLSIGDSCPTYPLRGYSLTMYSDGSRSKTTEKGPPQNLLQQPIKVDDMYCSSVGANMARIAGFGELVGYRDKATNVPSLAPKVLARYGKKIFPESKIIVADAMQCFRPLSPDDIPIVGEVRSVPGVYLHTGHGTLGWTLCLATSECLAQAMADKIVGRSCQTMYDLPGGISVERARLSPERFL